MILLIPNYYFMIILINYLLKWEKLLGGLNNWHMLHTYVCLLLLACTWHACSLFPYDFWKFSCSYNLILFKNLLLYIWPLLLFVSEKTDSLLFIFLLKITYFSSFHTNYLICMTSQLSHWKKSSYNIVVT